MFDPYENALELEFWQGYETWVEEHGTEYDVCELNLIEEDFKKSSPVRTQIIANNPFYNPERGA